MAKSPVPAHGYDERGVPIFALNAAGKPVCGAKTKSGPCQRPVRLKNGRCRNCGSGGRPLAENPAPATLKDRRRTKAYQSLKLLEKVEAMEGDPRLLDHRDEIEFLEALWCATAEEGLSSPVDIWKEACELYRKAVKEKDPKALTELGEKLKEGRINAVRAQELRSISEQLRKQKESEWKRMAQLESNLNAKQAMAYAQMLLAAVKEEVKNPAILRAIGLRFARGLRETDH